MTFKNQHLIHIATWCYLCGELVLPSIKLHGSAIPKYSYLCWTCGSCYYVLYVFPVNAVLLSGPPLHMYFSDISVCWNPCVY